MCVETCCTAAAGFDAEAEQMSPARPVGASMVLSFHQSCSAGRSELDNSTRTDQHVQRIRRFLWPVKNRLQATADESYDHPYTFYGVVCYRTAIGAEALVVPG